MPAPRRPQQPQQRGDRHGVGQRVGPGASAAVPGGQHPARHRGAVPDEPGPGSAQGGQRRHHVGERQRRRDRRGRRRRPERRPERLPVPGAQIRPALVHPAGREVGAVGHPDPPAGPLDRAGHREVVEHVAGDPGEPAGPRQRGGVHDEELAVRGAQRGVRRPLGPSQRQRHHPRPLQQRLHQPGRGTVGELARPRRQEVEPGAPQHRDRRGDGVRGQHHVRVDEDQHAPPRGVRELRAGVRLARQPRWRRGAGQHPEPRVAVGDGADDVRGAVGRAVVEHEQLEVGDAALGQQRCERGDHPVGLVTHRQGEGHRLVDGRGVGGRATQPAEVDHLVQRAQDGQRRTREDERTGRGHHGYGGGPTSGTTAGPAGSRHHGEPRSVPRLGPVEPARPAPHRLVPIRPPEDPDVPSHRRRGAPRGARRPPGRRAAARPSGAVGAGRRDGAGADRLPADARRAPHRDHGGLGARVLRGGAGRRRTGARAARRGGAARGRGRGRPAGRGRRRAHRDAVRRLRLHGRPRRRRCSACPRWCRWPGR